MKSLIVKAAIRVIGGVDGIVEIAIKWFNESVLARITDKAEFAAYAEDVAAFGFFLDGIMNRHVAWLSDGRRAALAATIASVNELANAISDANVTKAEVDEIINRVTAAIKAWEEESK